MEFKDASKKEVSEYYPVIGVSCHLKNEEKFYAVKSDYITAIEKAGGLPFIIPIVNENKLKEKLISLCDGLLLTGGFGKTEITKKSFIPLREQNPRRYDFDKFLIEYALKKDFPLLGICRGHQMLNEVTEGTINLKLPTETICHYQTIPKHEPSHNITIIKGTKLHRLLNTETIRVNSLHTQGIKTFAPGFVASAIADDGVIEAIESKKHTFIMGLQFHPEKMINNFPKFKEIFFHFVNQCKQKREITK